MDLDLEGDIIILDEAHNIEDACRSAASVDNQKGERRNLEEAMKELKYERNKRFDNEEVYKRSNLYETIETLFAFIANIIDFLKNDTIEVDEKGYTQILLQELSEEDCESIWLTDSQLYQLKWAFYMVKQSDNADEFSLSARLKSILSKFTTTYHYILKTCKSHFILTIKKEKYNEREHAKLVRTSGNLPNPKFYHEMQIISMSPAVSFSDLKSCHSIILASGTLSPLDSFESELGVKFKNKVEADHVICDTQVFCRYIAHGASGNKITNHFQNKDNVSMTKDLAQLIVDTVSKVIVGGILVFFSSYSVMNKMVNNMKEYGYWNQLM